MQLTGGGWCVDFDGVVVQQQLPAMSDQGQRMDSPLEKMTTAELTIWLQSKGFGAAIQTAFEGDYKLAVSVSLNDLCDR